MLADASWQISIWHLLGFDCSTALLPCHGVSLAGLAISNWFQDSVTVLAVGTCHPA